jgi:2-oxoglutarate ferredoxin oxidoreductase subunit alpha
MTDLDLGMNDNISEPLVWDDTRKYDRGKVLSAEELDQIEDYGRYLDSDGDAICYRTFPGTHPEKGSFFTRGTSRDEHAVYTERGEEYEKNMHRLMAKWETIKGYVPEPEVKLCGKYTDTAVLFFGTSEESSLEAVDSLANDGMPLNAMRIRAFPFNDDVEKFIASHNRVFVIEQNRDSQLRTLLMAEFELGPDKLKSVLCFDGTPISARNIRKQILLHMPDNSVTPIFSPQVASGEGE